MFTEQDVSTQRANRPLLAACLLALCIGTLLSQESHSAHQAVALHSTWASDEVTSFYAQDLVNEEEADDLWFLRQLKSSGGRSSSRSSFSGRYFGSYYRSYANCYGDVCDYGVSSTEDIIIVSCVIGGLCLLVLLWVLKKWYKARKEQARK